MKRDNLEKLVRDIVVEIGGEAYALSEKYHFDQEVKAVVGILEHALGGDDFTPEQRENIDVSKGPVFVDVENFDRMLTRIKELEDELRKLRPGP